MIPEDKSLGLFLSAPIHAVSIWWFAWTIPPYTNHSRLVAIAALVPLGFAINAFDSVLVGYLCDTYTTDAGSADAPMGFIRAKLIAVYPLVGPAVSKSLGNNVAASYPCSCCHCILLRRICFLKVWHEVQGTEFVGNEE